MNRKLILIAAASLLVACEQPVTVETDTRQLVRVAKTEQGSLVKQLNFSSTLRPVKRARLAFQSPGIVSSRPVELGQVVREGELLATLDNPELAPAQRSAVASQQEVMTRRDQARRDLVRLESLVATGAVGEDAVEQKKAELDALEASVAAADARVIAAGERLQDASLIAPFDGMISSINAEPGEFVPGGQPVLSIGGTDRLELEVMLPASLVSQVSVGAMTEVRIPQLAGLSWPGEVVEVAGIGDPHTGLFPAVVEVLVEAGKVRLRAGMLAQAWFDYSESEGLIVPLSAIVDPVGGDPQVFRVLDGAIATTHVAVSGSSGSRVVVSPRDGSGLSEGDLIVTQGHSALTEGQRVRTL
jgi:RND family efflux transporter MFP subunit